MKIFRDFSRKYAIIFALLVAVAFRCCMRLSGLIRRLLPDSLIGETIDTLIGIIWPVALTILLGYAFVITEKSFKRTFKAGIALFCFYLTILIMTVIDHVVIGDDKLQTTPVILLGLLSMIGIGIREEFIFRGLVMNSLSLKYCRNIKGMWFSLVLSGVLFGAIHMFNMLAGVTFTSALVQSISATGVGVLFGAVYLRGGNIWFLVLIHALVDSVGFFSSSFLVTEITGVQEINNINFESLISIPITVLIAIFLLRKSKRQEIFDRMEEQRNRLGW